MTFRFLLSCSTPKSCLTFQRVPFTICSFYQRKAPPFLVATSICVYRVFCNHCQDEIRLPNFCGSSVQCLAYLLEILILCKSTYSKTRSDNNCYTEIGQLLLCPELSILVHIFVPAPWNKDSGTNGTMQILGH